MKHISQCTYYPSLTGPKVLSIELKALSESIQVNTFIRPECCRTFFYFSPNVTFWLFFLKINSRASPCVCLACISLDIRRSLPLRVSCWVLTRRTHCPIVWSGRAKCSSWCTPHSSNESTCSDRSNGWPGKKNDETKKHRSIGSQILQLQWHIHSCPAKRKKYFAGFSFRASYLFTINYVLSLR